MGVKVLTALDTAKTQYYHFKAIIIAGMGLFTDAYDLFCVVPVTSLLAGIYYPNSPNYDFPPVVTSVTVAVALLGTAAGQLVLGRLGDLVGRRPLYGFALGLMVVSSFGCGFSLGTSRVYVLLSFSFFRFVLGVGIGGDYPLSATIMSEFANRRTRGAFIAAVFSMQGLGILFSSMVTMTVCAAFDSATGSVSPPHATPKAADLAWRIIPMLGAVPAALTFYWRMLMPETARYTALVERNVEQAAKDMEKMLEVPMTQITETEGSTLAPPLEPSTYPLFSKRFLHRHGRDLFSCAASWFLVDVVFYSSTLFQSRIYKSFLPEKHKVNAFQYAYQLARLQAIMAVCSTIPGYWATVLFIDRVGRRKIQLMGFCLMALALFSAAGSYHTWIQKEKGSKMGFMILALTFFFSNFGPNTTTFIVPAELFPARFRTTCHGISGAAGKAGAIIGSIGFQWASDEQKLGGYHKGIRMSGSLITLAVISLLGAVVTYFFSPETKGRSLEDNEKENDANQNNQANGLVAQMPQPV